MKTTTRDKTYFKLSEIAVQRQLKESCDFCSPMKALSIFDFRLRRKGDMHIIGKEEMLMGQFIDIITFLTGKLKSFKLIQSISIMERRRM